MGTPARYTDPYLHTYRPVPSAGPGVCEICHSGPNTGYDVCLSCSRTMEQVSCPTASVVPVSLYTVPSQLWHVLRSYKDAPPPAATVLATQVAAIIGRFTARHMTCISELMDAEPSVVTTVPSTRVNPTPGEHPLAVAVRRNTHLAPLHRHVLTRGPDAAGHNQASDRVFISTRRLDGEPVLLIDDTFTSGARVQSAASALYLAGAAAVTAVVIGRVINPDWNDNCRRIWDEASTTPFNFDECCLCRP